MSISRDHLTLLPREPKYTPTQTHRDIGMRRIDQIRRDHGLDKAAVALPPAVANY